MTTQRTQRYRQIVDHFEEVARANSENCVHVENLSRIAGINQRTLSRAFRKVRGTTPYRYLQHLRLTEVKRLLALEGGSVTRTAMRFGFRELGKFGVLYKKAFGESASQTRQRGRSMNAVSHHDTPHPPTDTKGPAP
jgi:transcriptional regulator GlxA family with amidase domain